MKTTIDTTIEILYLINEYGKKIQKRNYCSFSC